MVSLRVRFDFSNVPYFTEVIVFGEQESGKLSLILPKQFSIKLEKVDRTFLNVFVLKPIRDDYFHNVVIEYIG